MNISKHVNTMKPGEAASNLFSALRSALIAAHHASGFQGVEAEGTHLVIAAFDKELPTGFNAPDLVRALTAITEGCARLGRQLAFESEQKRLANGGRIHA